MTCKRKVELVTHHGHVYDGSSPYSQDAIVRAINRLDTDCPEVRRALDILVNEWEWLKEWRYAKPKGRPVKLGDKVRIGWGADGHGYSEGRVYKIIKDGVWAVRTHSMLNYPLGAEVFWARYPSITHADGTPIDWDATEVCDD